jgi:hypothetical protein
MADHLEIKKVREVFRNVRNHREMERIIRRSSTNPEDIRRAALSGVDLTSCRNVLELGCAFGSEKAGYPGRFSSDGVHQISGFPTAGVDLILCSFALYFFVDVLPDIARILTPDGRLIAITHASGNMRELIGAIRNILKARRVIEPSDILPIEQILKAFSAENGAALLAPHFGCIQQIDFPNTLVFPPRDMGAFVDYYRFKRPFFLAGTQPCADLIIPDLTKMLAGMAARSQAISMCKDDAIFICSQPYSSKESS